MLSQVLFLILVQLPTVQLGKILGHTPTHVTECVLIHKRGKSIACINDNITD